MVKYQRNKNIEKFKHIHIKTSIVKTGKKMLSDILKMNKVRLKNKKALKWKKVNFSCGTFEIFGSIQPFALLVFHDSEWANNGKISNF